MFTTTQQDKLLHILAGILVAAPCGLVHPLLAPLAALLVGAGKELYDHCVPGHTVDIQDLWAATLGGLFIRGLLHVAA